MNTSWLSPFCWNTGERSIMCSDAELRKARQLALVPLNLLPKKSNISISRTPQADADKTARIIRGLSQ